MSYYVYSLYFWRLAIYSKEDSGTCTWCLSLHQELLYMLDTRSVQTGVFEIISGPGQTPEQSPFGTLVDAACTASHNASRFFQLRFERRRLLKRDFRRGVFLFFVSAACCAHLSLWKMLAFASAGWWSGQPSWHPPDPQPLWFPIPSQPS